MELSCNPVLLSALPVSSAKEDHASLSTIKSMTPCGGPTLVVNFPFSRSLGCVAVHRWHDDDFSFASRSRGSKSQDVVAARAANRE